MMFSANFTSHDQRQSLFFYVFCLIRENGVRRVKFCCQLFFPSVEGSEIAAKRLYVPRVEDKNCHMRMLNISSMDDLIANSMDILEPAAVDSDGNVREDGMNILQSPLLLYQFMDKRN